MLFKNSWLSFDEDILHSRANLCAALGGGFGAGASASASARVLS